MKSSTAILQILVMVVVAVGSMTVAMIEPAFADKMSLETHDLVISKLEQSLKEDKDGNTISLRPIRARLADLYADRARLRSMDEAEKDCGDCKGASDDRKKALKLYEIVVREADKDAKGPLLLQMAHLYEINDEPSKAQALYNQAVHLGTAVTTDVMAESLVGRAENSFGKGDFAKAKKDFESALKIASVGRRGQIMQRIAWCELNEGETQRAVDKIVQILKTPELMKRDSSNGPVFDSSFQEDLVRDLATFLAHGIVGSRQIALLEKFTPEPARRDVMKHFASECERLGQKRTAIEAWAAYVQYEGDNFARLEAKVRVTQIRYDLGEKAEALLGLKDATQFWKQNDCVKAAATSKKENGAEECALLQTRLRKLVIDWNRVEKAKPSKMVLEAYLAYLSKFDTDSEMTAWAAEAARSQKQYATAATLYYKSSLLASSQVNPKASVKEAARTKEILETGLVGEVEMAEISKDARTREVSYNHYLQLNPNGAIADKVRYQRAHVAYELGQSAEASNRFHEFAASAGCLPSAKSKDTAALCLEAADLDLDSLVQIKNHPVVQVRAAEYARNYPAHHSEYLKIARTSVLKQSEIVAPQQALTKLAEADLSGADKDEKIRIYKTRISLAEKAQNLAEVQHSAELLSSVAGLSAADHEFALGKIAWAAEMKLDFNQAYAVSRKMKLTNLRPDQRALRLALLAELSGHDSRPHDEEYLRVSHDSTGKALVRAKLVRSAHNPVREFAKYEQALKASPAVYARLALEIYARTGDKSVAERALRVRGVSKEPAGQVMARQFFLREFNKVEQKLASQRLNTRSDKATQKTLAERLKLLSENEKFANRAIAMHDWKLQLITLGSLSRENERTYSDIMTLPIPKGLKPQQRATYQKLVAGKAQVYENKHARIEQTLASLWKQTEAFKSLVTEFRGARPDVRRILGRELNMIVAVAPDNVRSSMVDEMRKAGQPPRAEEVAVARNAAKAQPFNAPSIAKLRDLEIGRGRETMVAYLDARLSKLKQQGVQQ
jgi:hypothetical protein